MKAAVIFSAVLLTACVTINIYFPAAAAEKAADEIIKGIQQESDKPKPVSSWSGWQLAVLQRLDAALATVISSAVAAEADLTIDSPEIRQAQASMQSRFAALQRLYAQGFVGIQSDGLLVVRDAPLSERNAANKLVQAENADRLHLYQAIANANGHPEWLSDIKTTFAQRWVSNAQAGWWYQNAGGSWKQK